MPKCCADLIGENKVQKVAERHAYMDGFTIRICDNCRSRWFAPTADLPTWDDTGIKGPQALYIPRMKPKVDDQEAIAWRKYCLEHPMELTVENDMYLGPSFPELDCLTDVERMLAAIVHHIAPVYSARSGQTAYVGHVVNLIKNLGKWHDNLPPRPRGLPILPISRPTREEWR